jgi:hypothetical protein
MKLTKIAGDADCRNGDCPTVYRTDRGTIAVQGASYLAWRDTAWKLAVPFADYWQD